MVFDDLIFGTSFSVLKEICFGHPRIGDHIGVA